MTTLQQFALGATAPNGYFYVKARLKKPVRRVNYGNDLARFCKLHAGCDKRYNPVAEHKLCDQGYRILARDQSDTPCGFEICVALE